ncbi:MAG TPA: hypothetical protein VFF11_14635 [Candidatus Binatia bacterium]|nr:hypothetical protein [Candidatus Binatia bacterium]
MKSVRHLLFAGFVLLLAGCATGQLNWDAQVGVMTYNQAVDKLGRPARLETLSDGKTRAEWISHYNYGAYSPAMDDTFYNHAASLSPTIQERQMQESTLSLTFDTNNILTGWSQD